jgi:hypothetical protein
MTMKRTTLASIVAVALVAGCSTGPSSTPVASSSAPTASPVAPTAAAGSPSTSPASSPTATSIPSPSAVAATSTLRWRQIGTASGGDLVGFAGGYVALGGKTGVEFSPDGASWTPETLPFHVSKDHGITLGAGPASLATDGHTVVLVGSYDHGPCTPTPGLTGGGPECPSSPISWTSTDGKSWHSSYPWHGLGAPKGFHQGNDFTTVWAVPTGGFDAAEAYVANEDEVAGHIFHSSDGSTWTPLPTSPPAALKGYQDAEDWAIALAAPSGVRVVASYWYAAGGGSDARLFSSTPDGSHWMQVDSFAGKDVSVFTGVAPDPSLAPLWMLAGSDTSSLPTVWTSPDLASWTAIALPLAAPATGGSISALAATKDGYVAVGEVGAPDGTSVHSSWVSPDGAAWTRLPTPGTTGDDGPDVLADGPDGPIGFAVFNGSDVPPGVWALK